MVIVIDGSGAIPLIVGSSNNSPSALIPSSLTSLTNDPFGVMVLTSTWFDTPPAFTMSWVTMYVALKVAISPGFKSP